MKRRATITGLLLLNVLLTACSAGIEHQSVSAPVPGLAGTADERKDLTDVDLQHPRGKVTVWSYYEGAEWIIPLVRSKFPDVQVEVKTVDWDNYADKYLAAYDDGSAPDVLLADNNLLGTLVGMDVFEDLSTSPYEGEQFSKRFNESTMAPYRSIADNSLFALPLDVGPAVVYYRSDLFRQAGLPEDPEALSRYLEDPKNWETATLKLKQQGSWIAASEWDPIWMTEYSTGFFNRDLSFARNTSKFAAAIEMARGIRKNRLASGLNDLFSNEGKTALNNGEIAMFSNGWWFRDVLKSAAPDTYGKWRMMRLPLGLYGWAGSSGSAISASSNNKAAAWAVVSTLADQIASSVEAALSGKRDNEKDPFFGDQKLQTLYADMVRNMPAFTITPLDDQAARLWKQIIESALVNDTDPHEVLSTIEQLTMNSLQTRLRILKAGPTPEVGE